MQNKREQLVNLSDNLEDFISTNHALLLQSAIPERLYETIFFLFKNNPDLENYANIAPEVLLQLLTGEPLYLNMHIDKIDVHGSFMVFCAGMNGHPDSLEWLVENGIIQALDVPSQDEYGGEVSTSITDSLMILLMKFKNIPGLEWAADKNLLKTTIETAGYLIEGDGLNREGWLDGFIWFNNRFPEVLFGQYPVLPWYAEKIFLILKHPWCVQPKTIKDFQWLTGDLSFYDPKDYKKEMVWHGIQSGNMAVIDWLTRHGFITFPATALKKDLMSGSSHATIRQKAVACSGNIAVLEWAHNNALINWHEVIVYIANAFWLEGFAWIQDKFPSLMSKEQNYGMFHPTLEGKCRAVHVVAFGDYAIPLLEWYKKNKPTQLSLRDGNGKTLVHLAATCQNIPVLQWCLKNVPHLAGCNDNQWNETIVHRGACHKNEDIVKMGLSYDSSLAYSLDKKGANIAVYALHSLDPDYFNQKLALTKNPYRLENIYPVYRGSQMICVLKTLNQALNTNYQLNAISLPKTCYEENKALCIEIKAKLDRNAICQTLVLLLKGLKDEKSSLFLFSKDVFSLFCNAVINSYKNADVVSVTVPNNFFYKKPEKVSVESHAVLTVLEEMTW